MLIPILQPNLLQTRTINNIILDIANVDNHSLTSWELIHKIIIHYYLQFIVDYAQ